MTADLRSRVEAWIAADPDPTTQEELRLLLREEDLAKTDLGDRFAGSLEFGTAGLRGVLGGGPNRMNLAVVLRTTDGLARALLAEVPDAKQRGVVVGYDGRRLSRELAAATAEVLAAHGIRAVVFREVGPTPLAAFAVSHLGAAAGVMVTASHNPPEYNGYKVYWGNGAQIIPPVDSLIARAIDEAPRARDVQRHKDDALTTFLDPSVERAYLDGVRALSLSKGGDRAFPIVYTPLHGVGAKLAEKALAEAGFTHVTSVAEQREPDGAFPTVRFPNPEEAGAMDLSFALARKLSAQLVLANDPDADRLAVAVPDPTSATGYLQLTGNQVGVLLGHEAIEVAGGGKGAVLASCVSSPMLGAIAKARGVHYEETLTGFKWIANRALELLAKDGTHFLFGYEEALGYTMGELVRDKDGISAVVAFAELTARLRAEGKTVLGHLESIYRKYGLFVSGQVNVTRKGQEGAKELLDIMNRLRSAPPAEVGGVAVTAVVDVEAGTRRETATGATSALTLPKSNVLIFELAGNHRIIARPSGTEPKAKFYFDVCEPLGEGEPMPTAQQRADETMKRLQKAFTAIAGTG
ncbi:MAG: phospho-sugar mutase [Polyangiaceae bacterium]|nr:phospho-sugar mutase [Polyangiaceae bacterium]